MENLKTLYVLQYQEFIQDLSFYIKINEGILISILSLIFICMPKLVSNIFSYDSLSLNIWFIYVLYTYVYPGSQKSFSGGKGLRVSAFDSLHFVWTKGIWAVTAAPYFTAINILGIYNRVSVAK